MSNDVSNLNPSSEQWVKMVRQLDSGGQSLTEKLVTKSLTAFFS